jgi:hypothetical protein
VSLRRVDFGSDESWESPLRAFRPDVVIALDATNLIAQEDRLTTFLGEFSEVLCRGNGSYELECDRLRRVGFRRFRHVANSERGRPIIYCSKDPIPA